MKKLAKILLGLVVFSVVMIALFLGGSRFYAWVHEDKSVAQIAPKNGRFVETSEGTLHITIWGEENSKTAVFTHGMAAWGGLWKDTAENLSKKGFRVIAVDQPPFGFSDRSTPDFSRSKQAARMNALATALSLKDYHLVGHSYGGGVALETALRHPKNIKALTLICPVIDLVPDAAPDKPLPLNATPTPLQYPVVAETLVSASVTNPLMTSLLTKQFMHRTEALTDEHIAILQKPMTLKGNTEHLVIWLKQFLAGDPKAQSRRREAVAELQVPLSLIWGEEDTVTPISQGEQLAQIIKPLSFQRLSQVGHMPQLEVPEKFSEVLIETLDQLHETSKAGSAVQQPVAIAVDAATSSSNTGLRGTLSN